MKFSILLVAATLSVNGRAMAAWGHQPDLPGGKVALKPRHHHSTFKQLIDHKNPDLGTFDQLYFYDTTHWKGPGSPVVFYTPGETNATNRWLTSFQMTGHLAERIGAATIVLEHRYWGNSSPFTDLSTANLTYLTLENSIKDVTHFAREVQLPFAPKGGSNAQDVPWVMMGGSYAGVLTAAVARVDPGTFWAYLASSAPVQAISDYWAYYLPIQQGMPQNCSKDVSLVIEHMDGILTHGSKEEQRALKSRFGMQDVEHNDDFMAALALAPWSWQGNQFGDDTGFWKWCDYIENAVNAKKRKITIPGPEGVGLEKALNGYAAWWKDVKLPDFCSSTYKYAEFNTTNNTRCYDTYNASSPLFTDTSPANQVNRQWIWMTCNEPFGYWHNGSPPGRPTLVSRLLTTDYALRQCGLMFPPGPNGETYGLAAGRTEADVNAYTGGWSNINTSRLIFVNGEFDPWREASVSADAEVLRGGPLQSTPQVPVEIVPGGFHCSDMSIWNGIENKRVRRVQKRIVKQLEVWVKEWPKKRKDYRG